MQELPIAVDKRPKETNSAQRETWPAPEKTSKGFGWANSLPGTGNEPDAPGFHGQRLAAMAPETDEIDEQDQKNVYPQDDRRGDVVRKDTNQQVRKNQADQQ
jgi:hypothetical protein